MSEKIFMSSDDYVISQARARLIDWAKHEGELIQESNDDYVISNNPNSVTIETNLANNVSRNDIFLCRNAFFLKNFNNSDST